MASKSLLQQPLLGVVGEGVGPAGVDADAVWPCGLFGVERFVAGVGGYPERGINWSSTSESK
jgi:hypothetical protein